MYGIINQQGEKIVSPKQLVSVTTAVTIVAAVCVIAAVFLTNPTSFGPVGVTIWFIGVLVALQGGFTLGLYTLKSRKDQPGTKALSASWRQGLLLALAITVFLALSSLQQLGLRDVILISAVLVLVEFYFRTRP